MGWLSNTRRVLKVLDSTGWFRGHRYVFARAARNVLHMWRTGERRLRVAEISLGRACQLHCRHCYATDVTAERPSLELLEPRIDALGAAGCLSVMLVGGEPTLRPDLEDIVRRVRSRRMLPFVFSNGQRLPPERLAALAGAGLFGLLLSALGTGDRHDAFVGQAGAFDRLVQAIDDARAAGLWVSLNTTATHDNLASGDFAALSRLARERGIGLKFNYPALLGRYSGRFDELLGDEEREMLDRALLSPHVSNDMHTSWLEDTCPAGPAALYITDQGEVTPCAYIPLSFGNLGEEPLAVIHERMARSPYFSRRHQVCLVGEDREFIARFLGPTFGTAELPLRWDRHPLRDELVAPEGHAPPRAG